MDHCPVQGGTGMCTMFSRGTRAITTVIKIKQLTKIRAGEKQIEGCMCFLSICTFYFTCGFDFNQISNDIYINIYI